MSLRVLNNLTKKDLEGKKVLLRVDFNVPMKKGKVVNDNRITEAIPTIKYLLDNDAAVIICSHLGRPDGKPVEELRLDPIARRLEKLIKKPVKKMYGCIEKVVQDAKKELKSGEIMLLENTRFYPEEEENDRKFSKELARHCDFFVSDAFGCVHRAHASTVGVSHFMPSYAGLLVQKEVEALSHILHKPEQPLVIIIGGSKIDTKIGVIHNFFPIAKAILIGGGLANTLLAAQGFNVRDSLCEKEKIDMAKKILSDSKRSGDKIKLPIDAIVSKDPEDEKNAYQSEIDNIGPGDRILDIGEESIKRFIYHLKNAKTIVWNGPVGYFEKKAFANGSKRIAEEMVKTGAKTYIGGGDTVEAIDQFKIPKEKFTHVSTGGGAMLEFLEGRMLPGIEVLTS